MLYPLYLSVQEAVRIAGVGRTKLYEALGSGALGARKLGRRTLISVKDLQTWLDSLPALQSKGGRQ